MLAPGVARWAVARVQPRWAPSSRAGDALTWRRIAGGGGGVGRRAGWQCRGLATVTDADSQPESQQRVTSRRKQTAQQRQDDFQKKHDELMSKSDALLDLGNSRKAIWASIAGGSVVFAGKLMVVMYCGGMGEASDSIVAETAHSFVDVMNQVFLLVGIQRSQQPISEMHPRGERFSTRTFLRVWLCCAR